jgi:hypothetical protein
MKARCKSSEQTNSNLSFAVLPVDDFTGERPLEKVSISIKELGIEGTLNSGGYHLFFDLNNNTKYTVLVKSDSKNYLDVEEIVDLAQLRQNPNFKKNPVVPIILYSSPSYPFSVGVTLIRGTVETLVDPNNIFGTEKIPVLDATVKITKLNLAYKTNKNGEYIFYFTKLRTDNIVEETLPGTGKKKYIKMTDNSSLFTLKVEHANYKLFEKASNKAEVGEITMINADLKPK